MENMDIFLDGLRRLIKKLLIENKNYENDYFYNCSKYDLLQDTKSRANYILYVMEENKHLLD
jgi:hypothetical protein